MRKYMKIGFLLLYTSFTYGQDKWCHYYTTIAGTFYEMGEFCGDTVINNKNYDIVLLSVFNTSNLSLRHTVIGGYRRISNDSVFFLHTTDPLESERLLYSFHLKVNDTIVLSSLIFEKDTFRVFKIDTINIFGKERQKFYLRNEKKNFEYDDVWIEGIGSIIHGYLWSGLTPYVSDLGSSFSCYYDGQTRQTYAPYDSLPCHLDQLVKACSIPSSSKNSTSDSKSIISPNPFDTQFDVYTRNEHIEISIYNVTGELIKSLSYTGNHKSIDCDKLSAGIYIVKLKVGRVCEVFKVLKSRS
jgi:hypothetical protein